jgi:hypothetical protein
MLYTKISRLLIDTLEFRKFSTTDHFGFAGVSSPLPLIAENEDEGILMIIDGDTAELYAFDGSGGMDCVDVCDNIRELPYKTERELRIEAEIAAMEQSLAVLRETLQSVRA